jgi:arylsulfatase A-like enzyme
VDLIPYINGKKKEEPHEYLFWLNNEPGDAERRHMIAVRWKKWRLYKKYAEDDWQLFDLVDDPKEENNLAKKHPQIMNQLSSKHAAWVKTLAPLGKIPKLDRSDDRIGTGHGWAYAQK